MTRRLFFAVLLVVIVPLCCMPVRAGGSSYVASILDIEATGNDEYRLVLEFEDHDPRRVVLHLRFYPRALGDTRSDLLTKRNYLDCIAMLKTHWRDGRKLRFGFMIGSYVPMPGTRDEYRSNALALLTEHGGSQAIYTFYNL